jgi:FixJ family two-component response regulator
MTERFNIALIDDEEAILDSVQLYLSRRGLVVACYRAASDFLDALASGTPFDCIVTDVKMPGMSGLALQRALVQKSCLAPLIMITGHGDIDMAVSAIKAGAFDFIEKPIDDGRLLDSIREAVRRSRERIEDARELAALRERHAQLSERQRQVVELAGDGLSNKEIGVRLRISPRTAEHYREMAMHRMQATRLAELIHMLARLRRDA